MARSISYEGIDVSFSDRGTGRPIVLLHGYLESKAIWEPLSDILERSFRVVAVDLPGHGCSGVMSDVHTMEFMAGAVKEVIDQLALQKVIMVGHSLGGYVTLAFLELYPQLLWGYSLFHSHPNPDSKAAVSNRNREISVVKAGKKNIMYPGNITKMFAPGNIMVMKEEMARSRFIAAGTSAEGIIASLNGMITRPSRKALLERGERPLLWILGRNDQYFLPDTALAGVDLPSNAQVVILEESGHLGFVEETRLSASLLSDFADRLIPAKVE